MARTAKISKNIWNLAIPAVSLSLANRYEFIADIFIDAIKRIPAIHFFGNVAVCQNKGVRSLFIHTNQLFLAKWQTAEQKVSTRRTVTSIRYLSTFSRATLQSNLHTQQRCVVKKLTNLFAEFETLHTFVSATSAIQSTIHISTAIKRGVLGVISSLWYCTVAKLKGLRAFLHTYLNNFCYLWQPLTKAELRRKTVTCLHSLSPLTSYRRISQSNSHTPLVRSMQPMRSASRYSHAASSICASVSTSNQSSCLHRNVVEIMKTTDIRTLFRKAEKPMSIAYISKRTGMTVEECENRICDLATTCDTFAIVCKVMSRRRRFSACASSSGCAATSMRRHTIY